MSRDNTTLETLDRKMAELASFLTPSEIFRALLEGTVTGSPKAAIFLLREGRWKGWTSIGYPASAARALRQAAVPADSGWLSSLAAEEDVRWRSLTSGEALPDFGQPHAEDTVGLPVRVGGKAVAIVIAERGAREEPWSPAALSVLCQAARLRLELDLAWRRLKSAAAGQEISAPAQSAPPTAPVPAAAATVFAHPSDDGTAVPAMETATAVATATELAPWTDAQPAGPANPRREEARRFARLIATDIRLYNEEAVVVGRRQRDLTKRLEEPMKRGREAFAQRFPDLGADGTQLLNDAYVQVLAGGDASLI